MRSGDVPALLGCGDLRWKGENRLVAAPEDGGSLVLRLTERVGVAALVTAAAVPPAARCSGVVLICAIHRRRF